VQRCRIVLYSHDTMGLGHMRRNLLIAQTLAAPPLRAIVLLITGAQQINSFTLPSGVDCFTLPALFKNAEGQYSPRHLDISLRELIALRGKMIRAALEAFKPDVFVADNVARGAVRELDPALEYLRGRTRCVLGLRDVLDDPETVHRQWRRDDNENAIRDFYDAVWVYGDPVAYDLVHEYRLSEDVAEKVRYTGYLDQRFRIEPSNGGDNTALKNLGLPANKLALCLCGGGQDGVQIAVAFAEADLPPDLAGLIVTGPFMPKTIQQYLHNLALRRPRLRVIEFFHEPTRLINLADRVVSMGGYNTTCEVLSFAKRALIVPRTKPRREQLIRAERLSKLGLLDFLHPDELTPEALSEWLRQDLIRPPIHDRIDMNGLIRLPWLLQEVLSSAKYPNKNRNQMKVTSLCRSINRFAWATL